MVGLLEGVTGAIGDELTLLHGHRSTRLTAAVSPEERIQTGVANASSADGITVTFPASVLQATVQIGHRLRLLSSARDLSVDSDTGTALSTDQGVTVTLSSGTFDAAVRPGHLFRVQSGPQTDEQALIMAISADRTEVTLEGVGVGEDLAGEDWEIFVDLVNHEAVIASVTLGGSNLVTLEGVGLGYAFTNESWEVVDPADTSFAVETTLGWPEAGILVLDGIRYRYGSKTIDTIDDVRRLDHVGRETRIAFVAGVNLVDGELIEIDDGDGLVWVVEIDKDESIQVDRIRLTVTNAMTANQVRDEAVAVLAVVPGFPLSVFSAGASTVGLWNTVPGGTGFIDVVSTVAHASFRVDGARGAEQAHAVLTEVTEYSETYSGFDRARRGFFVETAEGSALSTVGRNLGVDRPSEIPSDLHHRRLIQAKAYAPAGAMIALRHGLEALLGRGNFEIFEDFTKDAVGIEGIIHHPCTVYVRRTNDNELDYRGKAYVDGEERRPITDTTHVDLSSALLTGQRVTSLKLDDEPYGPLVESGGTRERGTAQGRLVAQGTGAYSTDEGRTILLQSGSGSFGAEILAGDIFELIGGNSAGKRAVVMTRAAGQLELTDAENILRGAPLLAIGEDFAPTSWRVMRDVSNVRHYRPSSEQVIEYVGGALTTVWTYTGDNETTRVLLGDDTTNGKNLEINDVAGETARYRHPLRIQEHSDASFEMRFMVETIDTGSTDGRQFAVRLRDGTRELALGCFYAAGLMRLRPIDSSGVEIGSEFVDLDPEEWVDVRLVKQGTKDVDFFVRRGETGFSRFARVAWASFSASAATEVEWGAFVSADDGLVVRVKQIDWAVTTAREYANTQLTNCSLVGAGSRDLVDDAAGGLFRSGDVGRQVQILSFATPNNASGNPLGVWEIEALVGAGPTNYDRVTLVGPKGRRARIEETTNIAGNPRRVTIVDDPFAFTWPNNLGHQVEILTGQNARVSTIVRLLDPIDLTDLADKYPNTLEAIDGTNEVPFTVHTNVCEVTTGAAIAEDDEVEDWRLVPGSGGFVTDAAVTAQIIDTLSVASATVTLRQALPIAAPLVVSVGVSRVQSAHLDDAVDGHIATEGTGAASLDGIVVTLPPGATDGVNAGAVFYALTNPLPPKAHAVIAEVGPGDEVTLKGDGLGDAFSGQDFRILAGPENVMGYDDDLFTPLYIADNFGMVRQAIQDLAAYGVVVAFDELFRDAAYATGVEGLHVIED